MPRQPPVFLSVKDPNQVSSPHVIEVFIGSPRPRRLLIFTGIAIPNVESQGLLDQYEVFVNLETRSNVAIPRGAESGHYTATVGLAGISNTDSDFLFSTDDIAVFTEGPNNDLKLVCNLGVLGVDQETSTLTRFSYQATLFLDSDPAFIAGTIRWDPGIITHQAASEGRLFTIEAFTITQSGGGSGVFGGTVTRTTQKIGQEIGQPDWDGNLLALRYQITEPPLGIPLLVSVTPNAGAFSGSPSVAFVQVSGPSPIALSGGHLHEAPVDFLAQVFGAPR